MGKRQGPFSRWKGGVFKEGYKSETGKKEKKSLRGESREVGKRYRFEKRRKEVWRKTERTGKEEKKERNEEFERSLRGVFEKSERSKREGFERERKKSKRKS